MHKRDFIVALIGVRHRIALIALLTFIAGSQNVNAQPQIAQDAYAIFQASAALSAMDPTAPFGKRSSWSTPRSSTRVALFRGTPTLPNCINGFLDPPKMGRACRLGKSPFRPSQLRRFGTGFWLARPIGRRHPTTDRPFISPAEIMGSIETHLMTLEPFDRAFARYFTMTHLYNAGETAEILREYQKALSKLVNSLSWGSAIINPHPIDPHAKHLLH